MLGQDSSDQFELYLIGRKNKDSTIKSHFNAYKIICKNVKDFTKPSIDLFFLSLKRNGRKNTYINKLIDTVRVYSQFAHLDEELQHYKFLPEEQYVKATMSDEEIEAFLNLPPLEHEQWNRWRTKRMKRVINKKGYVKWTAFFSIMAYTGMRPGEVASLTVDDIDWGRRVFVVDETKTNDFRYVPIPPNAIEVIKEHLATLRDRKLFPTVDDVDWNYNFHSRRKRLGIVRKNLTPYSLRHSFVTRLLEEDVNIFKVQKIVGHKDLKTTALYTHMTTKDTIEAVKKHPLIRKATSPLEKLRSFANMIMAWELDKDKALTYSFSESEKEISLCVRIK